MKIPIDCRDIDPPCKYLNILSGKNTSKPVRIVICEYSKNVLEFKIKREWGIQDIISSIKILFNCPHLQKLRKKNKAPHVEYSIQ